MWCWLLFTWGMLLPLCGWMAMDVCKFLEVVFLEMKSIHGKWASMAFLQRRIDDNGDGFTDAPTMERVVATIRHQRSSESRRSRWTAKGYLEERFGGQLNFQEADRGTDNVYGERVDLRARRSHGAVFPRTVEVGRSKGRGVSPTVIDLWPDNFDAQEMVANLDAFHSGWTWERAMPCGEV